MWSFFTAAQWNTTLCSNAKCRFCINIPICIIILVIGNTFVETWPRNIANKSRDYFLWLVSTLRKQNSFKNSIMKWLFVERIAQYKKIGIILKFLLILTSFLFHFSCIITRAGILLTKLCAHKTHYVILFLSPIPRFWSYLKK